MSDSSYLVEFHRVGNIVKVTAIDPVTGLEVVIQGPVSAGEHVLSQTAVKKLEYMLRQKHGGDSAR